MSAGFCGICGRNNGRTVYRYPLLPRIAAEKKLTLKRPDLTHAHDTCMRVLEKVLIAPKYAPQEKTFTDRHDRLRD